MSTPKILLSQAHVTDVEVAAVARALMSGWVAPLGPEVDGFEADICDFTGASHAVALSSGTAAIHLGLLAMGVGPGDEVIVPTLTFGATAFAVTYTGANPVFVDVEEEAWGLDPEALAACLADRRSAGAHVAAVVPVDLFGRPADYDRILAVTEDAGVAVLVDAAESLGASHDRGSAGTLGSAGIFSFNGNKIMTTSGGGMLVSGDESLVEKVRFWSTQSREPLPWYEHREIGFNYRMSNILAALGRAQLSRLPEMIARRSRIRQLYREHLVELAGVEVSRDPSWGSGNSWLTTIRIDSAAHPDGARIVREALTARGIEVRPVWKPMHQQPVFRDSPAYLSGLADSIFREGLCLPSGVGLTDADVATVAAAIKEELR